MASWSPPPLLMLPPSIEQEEAVFKPPTSAAAVIARVEPMKPRRRARRTRKPSSPSYRYQCRTCPRYFTQKCHLQRHEETHLPYAKRKFGCPFDHCDRRFNQRGNLEAHLQVHARRGLDWKPRTPAPTLRCEISGGRQGTLLLTEGEAPLLSPPAPATRITRSLTRTQSLQSTTPCAYSEDKAEASEFPSFAKAFAVPDDCKTELLPSLPQQQGGHASSTVAAAAASTGILQGPTDPKVSDSPVESWAQRQDGSLVMLGDDSAPVHRSPRYSPRSHGRAPGSPLAQVNTNMASSASWTFRRSQSPDYCGAYRSPRLGASLDDPIGGLLGPQHAYGGGGFDDDAELMWGKEDALLPPRPVRTASHASAMSMELPPVMDACSFQGFEDGPAAAAGLDDSTHPWFE